MSFRAYAFETVRLATPLMVAQLATIALGVVDTVTFGLLGTQVLAAGGLAVAVFSLVHIVCIGVLMAVGNQVAWLHGAGDDRGIGDAVEAGLVIAIALGATAALGLASSGPLLLALGQDPTLVNGATTYLWAAGIGIVPSLVFTALRGLTVGMGRSGPVTAIAACAILVKIALNGWLIAMPEHHGTALTWIGLSTTATFTCMAVALAWYCRRPFAAYVRWPRLAALRGRVLPETVRLGIPIGVTYGVEAGLFTGVALIMGNLGAVPLAAHHVANQCAYLTFMVAVGLSHATSVRVGHAAGRGRVGEARRIGYQGLVLGLIAMTGTALVFLVFGKPLARVLVQPQSADEWAVVELAAILLVFATAFQWFDGLQNIAMGALRGLKDPGSAMVAALLSYWLVGLPVAWLLAQRVEPGAIGAWVGLAVALATASALLLYRFNRLTVPREATLAARNTWGETG